MNLTAVYSRETVGWTLTLSATGWTYQNTFVLYDYETESLWYPLEVRKYEGLRCISGAFADKTLKEFPSIQTRWSDWISQNPGSLILDNPDNFPY